MTTSPSADQPDRTEQLSPPDALPLPSQPTPTEIAAPPVPGVPPQPPEPPGGGSASQGSRWSRLSRGAVLALGVALGAATVGACWLSVSLIDSAPETFGTDGTITLTEAGILLDNGDPCTGLDGYDDIHMGAQVDITDAAGTLVASGSLGPGKMTDTGCRFPFTVDGITPGSKFYTIEVSRRGGLTHTEKELRAGDLAFTLG